MKRLKHYILLSCGLLAFLGSQASGTPALIPLPAVSSFCGGDFTVTTDTPICPRTAGCAELADYLNDYLGAWLGTPLDVKQTAPEPVSIQAIPYISLSIDSLLAAPDGIRKRMPAEGYTLSITPRAVRITGVDRAGLFYGIQTFLQLLPADIYRRERSAKRLAAVCAEITDWPRFAYRGMMLDVARTFSSKESVKRFINLLSLHKINRLHWHLADDEGWRIEIKAYPELAKKGGYRGRSLPIQPIYGDWDKNYGGYYTQDDIREIVAYAAMRNIEVIPEIDLPGHSRAFARLHPEILCPGKPDTSAAGYDRRNVWCATREANYAMLSKILSEVCALFPSKYIHIGGDEVQSGQWLGCPTCRKLASGRKITPILDYFVGRLTKILADNGKKPVVWGEAAESGSLDKSALVSGWQNIGACSATTANGYKTVIMPGSYFYFDMKQSPWERGLTWAGIVDTRRAYSLDLAALGFSASQMTNVAGVEGAFWSELLLSGWDGYLDYQCYPRICALAEVGWSQQALRNNEDFHNRLYNAHFDRLTAMGIAFRIPPPEAVCQTGKIAASTPLPENDIRYKEDGSDADQHSPKYLRPLPCEQMERYRFCAVYGDRSSAVMPAMIRNDINIAPGDTICANIPLPEEALRTGLWYLRVRSTEPEMKIRSIRVIAPDTTYYIIRSDQDINELHQMRFYATESSRSGRMLISMKSNSRVPALLSFQFERSPYIEPPVTVTSTIAQDPRFPLSKLTDYNFTTYARTARTCKKGDVITFTFARPVDCYSIEVHTGLSYLPRYHIPMGRVETSRDGINFTTSSQLDSGCATVLPKGSVKALRIVSMADGNGEGAVAIQDLKIIPQYK